MTLAYPDDAVEAAVDSAFSDAFRADPDLAAQVADAIAAEGLYGARGRSVAPPQRQGECATPVWVVIVTYRQTETVTSVKVCDDPRDAIRNCRDLEQTLGAAFRATLYPAWPLSAQADDGGAP